MALSMHLFTLTTQVPERPEALTYATAVVLLGDRVLFNAASSAAGLPAARKKW